MIYCCAAAVTKRKVSITRISPPKASNPVSLKLRTSTSWVKVLVWVNRTMSLRRNTRFLIGSLTKLVWTSCKTIASPHRYLLISLWSSQPSLSKTKRTLMKSSTIHPSIMPKRTISPSIGQVLSRMSGFWPRFRTLQRKTYAPSTKFTILRISMRITCCQKCLHSLINM